MAEPPKGSDKKYFDVAPPKPISAPLINTQKRRILSKTTPIESTNTDVNEAVEQKTDHTDTIIEQAEVAHEQVSTVSHPDFNIPVKTHKETPTKQQEESEPPESGPDTEVPVVDSLPTTAEKKESETTKQDEIVETTTQPTETEAVDIEKTDNVIVKNDKATKDDNVKKTDTVVQEPETDKPVINLPEDDGSENQAEEREKDANVNEDKQEDEILTAVPEKFVTTDSVPDPGQQKTEEAKENMQEPRVYDTKEYYVPIGKSHHTHGGIKGAFVFGVICAAIVLAAALYFMYMLDK